MELGHMDLTSSLASKKDGSFYKDRVHNLAFNAISTTNQNTFISTTEPRVAQQLLINAKFSPSIQTKHTDGIEQP